MFERVITFLAPLAIVCLPLKASTSEPRASRDIRRVYPNVVVATGIELSSGRAVLSAALESLSECNRNSPEYDSPSMPGPLRILAVDDDVSVLALYRAFLQRSGHTVVTAMDGVEALAHFKAGHWDVVLTDRAMPKLAGGELAAAVKAVNPRTPVIMVSGLVETLALNGDLSAVDLLIRKPFTVDELLAGIATALAMNRVSGAE